MTDRTKPWAKCWRETWRDEASDRLDMCATLVRQFLAQHVGAVDEHGTGWATTREGRPMVLANIARPCKATHEQAEAALRQLVDVGLIVERDGAWGTLCWATTQEDPEAKRKREWREKQAGLDPSRPRPVNVPGHVPSMSRDGDDQRTEDRGQNPPMSRARARRFPRRLPPRLTCQSALGFVTPANCSGASRRRRSPFGRTSLGGCTARSKPTTSCRPVSSSSGWRWPWANPRSPPGRCRRATSSSSSRWSANTGASASRSARSTRTPQRDLALTTSPRCTPPRILTAPSA